MSLSFDQAWQMLLSNNDGLSAEQVNIKRATNLESAAAGLNYPKINLNAAYTRLDRDLQVMPSDLIASMPIGQIDNDLNLDVANLDSLFTSTLTERDFITSSITAIWPIYTGGKITVAQDIAAEQVLEANSQYALKEQQVFQQLAQYYFAVVLSKEVLTTKIAYEQGLAEHLSNARKLESQGQIAKVERLQAEVSADRAMVSRKKSLRDLEIATLALAKLIKTDAPISLSSPLFTNQALPALSEYQAKTLEYYPGLKLLTSKESLANNVIKLEKSKYYPEVFLFGNYHIYKEESFASDFTPDWEIGVGLKIPIMDNSGRSGKTQAAQSQVLQVRYLKAQAKSDLNVLVEKVYKQCLQAIEQYYGLRSSVALAEENIKLRKTAFSQGLSNSLSVVDAHIYLESIRTEQLLAAYQYVTSLSQLLALSGDTHTFQQFQSNAALLP
jgi:outer membrane protein TolC